MGSKILKKIDKSIFFDVLGGWTMIQGLWNLFFFDVDPIFAKIWTFWAFSCPWTVLCREFFSPPKNRLGSIIATSSGFDSYGNSSLLTIWSVWRNLLSQLTVFFSFWEGCIRRPQERSFPGEAGEDEVEPIHLATQRMPLCFALTKPRVCHLWGIFLKFPQHWKRVWGFGRCMFLEMCFGGYFKNDSKGWTFCI